MQRQQPNQMQTFSLTPDHKRAIAVLAKVSGDANMSGLIRRVIEKEMRSLFGPKWRLMLDELEVAA